MIADFPANRLRLHEHNGCRKTIEKLGQGECLMYENKEGFKVIKFIGIEEKQTMRPAFTVWFNQASEPDRSLLYTLFKTSSRSSVTLLATITSETCLKSAKLLITLE